MTVICKVGQCPFITSSGFCRNKLLSITQNGLCGHIYNKNGQVKSNWQQPIVEQADAGDGKFLSGVQDH